MDLKKQDFIKSLKIDSKKELQKYILNKWLELAESEKLEHSIIALKGVE
jgi:hypothetical protein